MLLPREVAGQLRVQMNKENLPQVPSGPSPTLNMAMFLWRGASEEQIPSARTSPRLPAEHPSPPAQAHLPSQSFLCQ